MFSRGGEGSGDDNTAGILGYTTFEVKAGATSDAACIDMQLGIWDGMLLSTEDNRVDTVGLEALTAAAIAAFA